MNISFPHHTSRYVNNINNYNYNCYVTISFTTNQHSFNKGYQEELNGSKRLLFADFIISVYCENVEQESISVLFLK